MKKFIMSVFLIASIISCKNKSKINNSIIIGDFSFSSKEITQNIPFTITYNGTNNIEEGFYQQLYNTKVLAKDLVFTDNKATITIADSISAVALNFKINGDFDTNNKQCFLFKVKDKNGKLIADSEASLEYYKMTNGRQFELKSDAKIALATIETALATNPNLTEAWMKPHIFAAYNVSSSKGKKVSEAYLSKYTSKPEMKLSDYEVLGNIYAAMRNEKKWDSIADIAAKKYPDSDFYLDIKFTNFIEAKDLNTKEALFITDKDRFLKSKNADYIVTTLAMLNYRKGTTDAFKNFFNLISKTTEKASLLNSIAWPKAEKGEDIEEAAKLSMQALKLIEEEQKALKDKPDYYSLNQYKNNLKNSYNMYADTYALSAFKKGNVKDAVKYQRVAVSTNNDPEMNERYVQFLLADSQYKTAKDAATLYIEEGNSTAKLKDYFIEAHNKSGDTANAKATLADLELKAKQKELNDLRKTLIDEDATDFTLKNLDGQDVTLSTLKGKTVVLDFWATWCGPCIASFPGMQKVVTKYKDNDDVVFLFVDTFEGGKDRVKNVRKFIEDNNYDFHVLIDSKVEDGVNKYKVANAYNITGIPTKIIIGPSGKIKFKSIGFSGSAEKVVSEIDTMVELLETHP